MPLPELHTLKMMFREDNQWRTRNIPVANGGVATLRYSDISLGPFFFQEGDVWRPVLEPHKEFGLPLSAVTDCEQRFMRDYLGLVARLANEWGVTPSHAPICLPQIVFELLDEERLRRDAEQVKETVPDAWKALPIRLLIKPRHFKKHPADISFFYDSYWRILEIDGPSHTEPAGRKKTDRRNELYKTINARVVAIEPEYDGEVTSLIEILKLLDIDLAATMRTLRS